MIADPAKIDELAIYIQAQNAPRGRVKSRRFSRADTLSRARVHWCKREHNSDCDENDLHAALPGWRGASLRGMRRQWGGI